MLVRNMELSDLDVIVKLEEQLFTSAWSKDDFVYELTQNVVSRYLVLEENEIVGYIGFWLLGDQSQITTIGISKEKQGLGYSKLLIDKCVEITKELGYLAITLEVRVSNVVAINLYQSYGFKIVSIRKDYYQDNNEDGYLMLKEMEV